MDVIILILNMVENMFLTVLIKLLINSDTIYRENVSLIKLSLTLSLARASLTFFIIFISYITRLSVRNIIIFEFYSTHQPSSRSIGLLKIMQYPRPRFRRYFHLFQISRVYDRTVCQLFSACRSFIEKKIFNKNDFSLKTLSDFTVTDGRNYLLAAER